MAEPQHPTGGDDEAPEELGLLAEYFLFLKQNRKWWLMPILLLVGLLGALLFFGSSPIAPFIYTLF
jgi:hypothetical protein